MSNRPRSKLIHLLISKSIAEALLVAGVAVGFYFATSNPNLRGVLDLANAETINGWAVDGERPWTRVEVQLFIDNEFVAAQRTTGTVLPSPRRRSRQASTKREFMRSFQTQPERAALSN